jgi:hypothetical protein
LAACSSRFRYAGSHPAAVISSVTASPAAAVSATAYLALKATGRSAAAVSRTIHAPA